MLRMRELVDEEPDVEYSPTIKLGELLGPDESEDSNELMNDCPPEDDHQMMSRVGHELRFTNVCTVSKQAVASYFSCFSKVSMYREFLGNSQV